MSIKYDSFVNSRYIFSAFGWSYVLSQLPGGWLLDRFGSRKMNMLLRRIIKMKSNRENLLEWGITDALFIDSKEVRTGPPPSYRKIKNKISRQVKQL